MERKRVSLSMQLAGALQVRLAVTQPEIEVEVFKWPERAATVERCVVLWILNLHTLPMQCIVRSQVCLSKTCNAWQQLVILSGEPALL